MDRVYRPPRSVLLVLGIIYIIGLSLLLFAGRPAYAAPHEDTQFWGMVENGRVTILLHACGSGSTLQIRSESLEEGWISDLFTRDGANNCGSPTPSTTWKIVINAEVGQEFNIYSWMGDSPLSEADFMQRARRDVCTVTSATGDVACDRESYWQPRIEIDTPVEAQEVNGTIRVKGWAIDLASTGGTGISEVEVFADTGTEEISLGTARYGETRGDVADMYDDPRFSNSGYTFAFNPRDHGLDNGPVTLRVVAKSGPRPWWDGPLPEVAENRQFTIINATNPWGCSQDQYLAEYFDNVTLSGEPVLTRCETTISHTWDAGDSPGTGVGDDQFSVRWTGNFDFDAGEYTFFMLTDDGMRVWLDDDLIFDRWFNQEPFPEHQVKRTIGEGNHTIRIEYFEDLYSGVAQFRYMQTPEVTSVSPDTAVANAGQVPIVISGDHLQAPVTVEIDGVALQDVTLEDPTTLYAVVPVDQLAQGTHDVVIDSDGYTITMPGAFEVTEEVPETLFRAMIYLACDNDLNNSGGCDSIMDNLERAMLDHPDLRIVVFFDGPEDGDTAYYLIQPDDQYAKPANYTDGVNRFPIGEANTGVPKTLVEFTGWAHSHYPGRYKFLSFIGHGGGWAPELHPGQPRGISSRSSPEDIGGMLWDNNPPSVLATRSMAQALETVTRAYSIDVLYLDACLMSSVEVMAEFAPYSDFIIAHENITWNIPDPYRGYFTNVTSDITPKELARHLTEVNLESLLIPGLPHQVTVIRTDAMDNVTAKLDGLATTLLEFLPTQRPFIREVVVQTARVDANNDWEITIEDQFIDAGDFAQNLIDHPEIPLGVKAAAQEFIDAIDQATLVNEQRSGAPFDGGQEWDLQALTGQSLYFPLADEWRREMYGPGMLPNFAGSTRWDDFIQSWYAELPAPEPPTEPCPECPIPPMSVSLSIGGPEIIPVDQTVYVPVFLNKVRQQDDVRGVQFALRSSKPELLSPLQSMKQPPRIGDFFAEESYMDAVPTNDTWSFVLNAPPPPAHAAEGSGIIVELPFKAKGTGCVTLEFTEHLIVTSTTGEVNHHAATRTICITDGGVITGTVYLESRTAGHYGDTQVVLSDGHRSYTTTTEPDGTFTLADIAEGDYTLTVFRRLFVTAIREVNLDGVETTTMSDIGLWAGDMSEDNAVTRHDWYICAAASIPVNDPDFDLRVHKRITSPTP